MLAEQLWRDFTRDPAVTSAWPRVEQEVLDGKLSASAAVKRLLDAAQNHDPKN
jgi:hypothetical protein